jgi:hypothetical protein
LILNFMASLSSSSFPPIQFMILNLMVFLY